MHRAGRVNSGKTTQYFKLQRIVRQWGPIFAYLFS